MFLFQPFAHNINIIGMSSSDFFVVQSLGLMSNNFSTEVLKGSKILKVHKAMIFIAELVVVELGSSSFDVFNWWETSLSFGDFVSD